MDKEISKARIRPKRKRRPVKESQGGQYLGMPRAGRL